jgi:hypothetical protein
MKAIYLTLVLISAATLSFQVALTRFFSLAQGHHFAFMAISLALLGIGASGTYLSLKQTATTTWRRTFIAGAMLFTVSVPAAYLAINYLPFDAYRIAWERAQLLWLVLYYLALAVPFFFSGLVVGTVLAARPEQAGSIYAANLLGAGSGPPLALLALATVGGPGTVFFCTLLGWLAVVSYQWPVINNRLSANSSHLTSQILRITFYLIISLALLYLTFRPLSLFDVQLTPYKSLSQARLYPGSQVVFSRWNAFSRVDVLRSEGIRSAPGLSFTYAGTVPAQLGLLIDGDNLSPITSPTDPTFTQALPLSLGFELRPKADVLVIEPDGGLAVLAALQGGARSVTVVQSNHTAVEVVTQRFADFNGNLYADPRVAMVIDEPRSFLRRTEQQFDLIVLPLTDSFRPVTAGAYTLSEDYRYTVEAMADALAHLAPDGLLVVERWLQLPPSESLRLWGTMIEGIHLLNDRRPSGQTEDGLLTTEPRIEPGLDPAAHLLALRSLQTSLVIAARSPFAAQDLAQVRNFVAEQQFDLIWLPDIQPGEANRYSIVPEAIYYQTFAGLLNSPSPTSYLADYPQAIAPPTDDHPFFFHFFKWQQTPEILQSLGKTWQPFGGSGYLVLVILLGLVVVLSTALILLPLLGMKRKNAEMSGAGKKNSSFIIHHSSFQLRYLLYFTFLGLGFLFIEIPLLQRFILYLGQPAISFAVVVSTLLVAGGIGSGYLSGRLTLRITLPLITLLAVLYPLLLPPLFDATLSLALTGRVIVTVVTLFPLGMLLGIPFPRGLSLVGQTSAGLTPWVWAVNGCASVVSAVLAAMIALTWGFSIVLWSAALAYGLAGVVMAKEAA